MSAGTESLIRAIQTNDPLAFYGWLHTLKGTPDLDAGVAGDPGITPLAVASVMYSKAVQSDRILAARYAAMVEALMDAGANPLVRIGERFVVRRGHTGKLERRRVDEGRTNGSPGLVVNDRRPWAAFFMAGDEWKKQRQKRLKAKAWWRKGGRGLGFRRARAWL